MQLASRPSNPSDALQLARSAERMLSRTRRVVRPRTETRWSMTKDSKGSGGPRDPRTLTRWIEAAERGDQSVLDELWRVLEPELRKIARNQLRCSGGTPSLYCTLVRRRLSNRALLVKYACRRL